MPDWSIDPVFADEPTYVPTGDECTCWDSGLGGLCHLHHGDCAHASRGENCGRTDCPECGREVSAQLRAEALLSADGVLALAREVVRIQELYSGRSLPEYAVTVVDLSMCRRLPNMPAGPEYEAVRRWSIAWAEGVVDEIVQNPGLQPGCYDGSRVERSAYLAGRKLVSDHSTGVR